MTWFVLLGSLLFTLCNGQPFSLKANEYVSYYHSSNCPRTEWCLQLNSEAQLLGQYAWQKYSWNGNFSMTFWYYSQLNNNNAYNYKTKITQTHNIISNCHSNNGISNITSFLFATETVTESTKTSYFDVYFNNSQQCSSIHTNNSACVSQNVLINNLWQFISIIYNEKTGFYVYSNATLLSGITWNGTKHSKNPIQSNNVLCIGDGDTSNQSSSTGSTDGFIELLSDIRFYNRSIDKKTMHNLYNLKYNLTRKDNNGIFVYYDFVNNSTENNLDHLCIQPFYIENISPKSISLNGGDTIHLFGNFGNDININNIKIVLYDKYNSKWKLNIAESSIISANINKISFNIKQSLNGICSDKIYVNVTSLINNCFINHKNVSIATYSPTIKALPDQLPAINNFNITVQSQCMPPNDNTLHCFLYLDNNIKRDQSAKIIISTQQIICQFPDLSSLLPSINYNLYIYSMKYNYSTLPTKTTIYNSPSIQELSVNQFTDNEQSSVLLVYGSNFIYSQPFDCNFMDTQTNKLIYHTKGEITANDEVSCLISTNLITPSNNYKFYLSSQNYFNSSKIPIIIKNSDPFIPNTIFIWTHYKMGNGIYPSGSVQYFYTQIVDESYNNFTNTPSGYEFKMSSANCPSIQFVMTPLTNGKLNWTYTAPLAFNSNNFSCKINFTAFDFNQHKITSYILFDLQFQTIKPVIKSINNTLFLINNITNFQFELQNLYIENYKYYYYKYNKSKTYVLSNNMSIQCVFTNAKESNIQSESPAILLSNNKHKNIQSMQCPNVIISEIGQYKFQFKMIQFKQTFWTQPFNKPNSVIYAYNLPTFDRINLNATKHIYLYGNNLEIGANALAICEWNVKCSFGADLLSNGYVINNTVIFCSMPDIDHHNLDNVLPVTVTYYAYKDSYNNIYQTFAPLLFLTNLSISFITQCAGHNCNGNGYCDYDAICHCDIGYTGDDCSIPLYYMLFSVIIIFFLIIISILFYFCYKYKRKYSKLKQQYYNNQMSQNRNKKGKLKYYGYKPIDDDDNLCCCFNLTPGHYGYYICCQFCCFCDERIIQIKLPNDDDSANTYTSTFHVVDPTKLATANANKHFMQQNQRAHNTNLYRDNNNEIIHNADSDSDADIN